MTTGTEENVNVDVVTDNALSMSDDQIAAMDFSDFASTTEQAQESNDAEAGGEEAEGQEGIKDEADSAGGSAEAENSEEAGQGDEEEGNLTEGESDSEAAEGDDEQSPDEDKEEGEGSKEDSSEAEFERYKAQVEEMLAPLQANGKSHTIETIEDMRKLAQMGMGFNKKMAALKPGLKVLKMLENNGLMDESKLGFLIDLEKKDPAAIAKLIKDSGIDPLDAQTEGGTDYKPSTYTVDDAELAFDEVIRDIEDTASYPKTIDVVSNKWDEASKQVAVQNPQVIRVLNDQMANGQYDQIMQVVESQRMLGNLNGVSDIQAYRQIGDQLAAAGKFGAPTTPAGKVVKKSVIAKPKDDKSIRAKKMAAAPTKAKAATAKVADFNPLSMTDEEIETMGLEKFLK